MNCPIISSMHLHELFMNGLWRTYEFYSLNILVNEHSRIQGIYEKIMNTKIHECPSCLQDNELSNNKFIAPSEFMNYSWIIYQ
jgi:hypothetical protein